MASRKPVECVNHLGRAERSKQAAQRAGQSDLGQERDAPSVIARHGRAIAEDEPPALATCFLRHRCEKTVCLLIGEREQSQLFATVESGDDTRRPAAKPSAA
jgi:hypothetical protein